MKTNRIKCSVFFCRAAAAFIALAAVCMIGCPNAAEKPIQKYAVTFGVVGEHGTLTASVDGKKIRSGDLVEQGKIVEFTAIPDTTNGWGVKTWSIVSTADNMPLNFISGINTAGSLTEKAIIYQSVTVSVEFGDAKYKVMFDTPAHGRLTATVDNVPVYSGNSVYWGKTVVFTADPDPNYATLTWILNGNPVEADSTYSLTVRQAVNISVRFTEKKRIDIIGDERVDAIASGFVEIAKGKTWGAVKTQIKGKCALKGEWQGDDYGVYQWKLNNENGDIIDDDYVFNEAATVYAVTNYTQFNMDGT